MSGNHTLPGPPQAAYAAARLLVPAEPPAAQTYWEGDPVFPPGGVIPPRPVQYGTSECRYPPSNRQVMYCLGRYWKLSVPSHMWALLPGFSVKYGEPEAASAPLMGGRSVR